MTGRPLTKNFKTDVWYVDLIRDERVSVLLVCQSSLSESDGGGEGRRSMLGMIVNGLTSQKGQVQIGLQLGDKFQEYAYHYQR